ncbi:MAG: efflux RND transporter periplasmic adaptor subunit [Planctomycetia bacterium]|nr:efflux RND transporter periplasmic adaptor subunit [Planctomycetia bacterium]
MIRFFAFLSRYIPFLTLSPWFITTLSHIENIMKRAIIIIIVLGIVLGGAAFGVKYLPKVSVSADNAEMMDSASATESRAVSTTKKATTASTNVGTETATRAEIGTGTEAGIGMDLSASEMNGSANLLDASDLPNVTSESDLSTVSASESSSKRRRFQTVDELPTVSNAGSVGGAGGMNNVSGAGISAISELDGSADLMTDSYGISAGSATGTGAEVSTGIGARTGNMNVTATAGNALPSTFQIPSPTALGAGQNSSTSTVKVLSTEREIENGVIIPIYEVDVPAEEAGVLRELYVEDFEQVKKDQTLVQLDDRQAVMAVSVAEAKLESAKIQMNNNVNVRYAIAAHNVADAEIKQADEANAKVKNTVTITEYNRLVLSRTQAKLQIEQAEQELKVAAQTYNVQNEELSAAKLDQTKFEIHSPHDGVVMELYRKQGEWLKPGDPILRLVQMNPIRYSFRIESKTPPESIFNQPVTIFVPTLNKQFQGKVTYIKPSHDIGDMYQVWVDIENTWQAFSGQDSAAKQKGYWILQPGMRAEVKKIGK